MFCENIVVFFRCHGNEYRRCRCIWAVLARQYIVLFFQCRVEDCRNATYLRQVLLYMDISPIILDYELLTNSSNCFHINHHRDQVRLGPSSPRPKFTPIKFTSTKPTRNKLILTESPFE